MIPKDLFKKIRQIEITTSRLVTDVFAGQYHSVFKGQGIEFDEVREYNLGDDVRRIDWNVTARTGKAHVKKFIEERELTVMVMIDASASSHFGSVHQMKNQLAAEVAALIAFSAIRNNDKVGLIIFTDKIEKFIPPRKGRLHALRVIRESLYFEPENHQTNIVEAVEYLSKVSTRKTIAFLISDFFVQDDQSDELHKALSIANKRHDVIAVTLNDPKESAFSSAGLMALEDAESGKSVWVDSSNSTVRKQYLRGNQNRLEARNRLFRNVGVDHVDISTHEPFADAMVEFFLKRRKHR